MIAENFKKMQEERWDKMLFHEAMREVLDHYGYYEVVEDKSAQIHAINFVTKPDAPRLNRWKKVIQ